MEPDKDETRVVLRRFKDERREVIALFPDHGERPGMCDSYMHVGQHGSASRRLTLETLPVREDEPAAAELLAELRSIGYRPRVLRRMPREA